MAYKTYKNYTTTSSSNDWVNKVPVKQATSTPIPQTLMNKMYGGNNTSNTGGNGGDTTSSSSGGIDLSSLLGNQSDLARQAWEYAKSAAADRYNNAQQYANDVRNQIAKKRQDFQDLFNQADTSINTTAESDKGEARRNAEQASATAGNRARALGLGGSLSDYLSSQRQENLARSLGSINQAKVENEQENQNVLNERENTAAGWENDLNNYLREAAAAKAEAENEAAFQAQQNASDYGQNILNNLSSILSAQQALGNNVANTTFSAINPTATGTQYTTDQLANANVNNNAAGTGATNLVDEDTGLMGLLKKFKGLFS